MQREYMHFYKGYWVAINKVKEGFNLKILTDDQDEVIADTLYCDQTRQELKETAEVMIDLKLVKA